jgi:hypothetical protein
MYVKRISLFFLAILSGVAVLSGAARLDVASAEELPGPRPHAAAESTQSNLTPLYAPYSAKVVFHVSEGVLLGAPAANRREERLIHLEPLLDSGSKGAGYEISFWNMRDRGGRAVAEVSWPILVGVDGSDTQYKVSARIGIGGKFDVPDQICKVTNPAGGETGPFHCSMVRRGLDWDWDLHLSDDRVERVAEASGAFTTEGSVSLGDGKFGTDSQLRINGAGAVGKQSTTQFDAVLSPFDHTDRPDTAQMRFGYALLDDGKPVYSKVDGRQLYILGDVSNKREPKQFTGSSSCDFVTDGGRIDENSGYSCDRRGGYAGSGTHDRQAHYFTDFVVTKK